MDRFVTQFVVHHAKGQRGCENPTAEMVVDKLEEIVRALPESQVQAFVVRCLGDVRLRDRTGIRRVYIVDGLVSSDTGLWEARTLLPRDKLLYEADSPAEVVIVSRTIKTHHDIWACAIFSHFCQNRSGGRNEKPLRHPLGFGRTPLPNIGIPLIEQDRKEKFRRANPAQIGVRR